ncbi:MAG: hypothetical protein KGD63_14915 [Candidatus Lokiarchaeota archaeon]|nr:hypothetical protein [Candidatus Lokiarchaeota archaeon]
MVELKSKLIKILMFGLSNSRKSSIRLCLLRKTAISNFTSLCPTIDYEIIKFKELNTNSKFVIWDFGGQKNHRIEHIKNLFDSYISGSQKLIYIIDIQDPQNYNLSLDYLNEIIKILTQYNYFIKISVYLHKYDDNIEIQEEEINNLVKRIKK